MLSSLRVLFAHLFPPFSTVLSRFPTRSPKGCKSSKGYSRGGYDYGYCDYARKLEGKLERNLEGKPTRNLCINMECCKDLRGGPPQCVPEGTCKAVHEHWLHRDN